MTITRLEILKAAPSPDLVICDGCDATTTSPPVGLPEGWDGVWRQVSGWVFHCPECLDRVEETYLAGGGGTRQPFERWGTAHD